MCGIAGFQGKGSASDMERMIRAVNYRGPDYIGVNRLNNVHFGHARLSIIDTSEGGHQPMYDPDQQFGIVFNGEIYNFQQLKDKLLATGKYQFRSKTDTEVLIYLYIEYGVEMVNMLNGMFAFCIYNSLTDELFLARDRMGQKPLHYAFTANSFVFGSELKSVVEHPEVSKTINIDGLNEYLTFEYVPTTKSIIDNVNKLAPGHMMVVKDGKPVLHEAYWEHRFEKQNLSLNEAVAEMDKQLDKATQIRLMSDVPLGVFLSGGLDSSTIAYYAQKNSSNKIKTFSIGFEDASYDESDYAMQVAKHIGTDHHTEIITPKMSLDLVPEIYSKLDEPFCDASLIPTYFLSKITRKHVTVALGGDGSDEMLAGYPTFRANKMKEPLATLPSGFSKFMLKVAEGTLPVSDKNISFDFKVKQFLRGFVSDKNKIQQLWLGAFIPEEKQKLLRPEIYNSLLDKTGLGVIDRHWNNAPKETLDQLCYYYYQTYLVDDILFKVDRASMYNSLEVRSPFLDKNVVEFLNSMPAKYKLKGKNGKLLLKKTMENKLPYDIIYRPKKGFGIPLSSWLRGEMKGLCNDLLSSEYVHQQGLFDVGYIEKLKKDHFAVKRNHRKTLWNLMVFQMWYRNFFE